MSEKEGEAYVKWFSELGLQDKGLVGSKAAYISELYRKKFPTPPGFVILGRALSNFTADVENEIKESYDILGAESVSGASASANTILKNSHEPPFVSLRISLEGRKVEGTINVKGKESLIENIKKLKESVGSSDTPWSIIVQKMVSADKAGNAYFAKNAKQKIVVEAVWGNGFALKLGMVEGDKYVVVRENLGLEIKEVNIAEKKKALVRDAGGMNYFVQLAESRAKQQVLENHEVKIVGQYLERVTELFESSQELLFAISGKEFYIIGSKDKEIVVEDVAEVIESSTPEVVIMPEKEEVVQVADKPVEDPRLIPMNTHEGITYQGVISNGEKNDSYIIKMSELGDSKELRKESEGLENISLVLSSHLSKNKHVQVRNELVLVSELAKEFPSKNISILIPGVKHTRNIEELKKYAKTLGLPSNIKFGVIIETPAALQMVNHICESDVDSVAVDLEGLSKSILSSDDSVDLDHEAVQMALDYILRRSNHHGVRGNIIVSDSVPLEKKHVSKIASNKIGTFFAKQSKANEIAKHLREIQADKKKMDDIENVLLNELNKEDKRELAVPDGFSAFF